MEDKTKDILACTALILWAAVLVFPLAAFLTMYIKIIYRIVVFLWRL